MSIARTQRPPSQTSGSRPVLPSRLAMPMEPLRRSLVHRLTLILVWFAVASSAFVFTEPAPTDVLTLIVIVLLPVVGLAAFPPEMLVLASIWMTICAMGALAALIANDIATATTHMAITLYLALAATVYGAFVARNPVRHGKLLLNAHLAAALIAAAAGLAGYFDLPSGTGELFTKFDRASGPFKDPNVFGPFLVPALVYALHLLLSGPPLKSAAASLAFAFLSLALLVSFSRGAWAAAAGAIAIFLYLRFVTTRRNLDRIRILVLGFAGLVAVFAVLATALQFDAVDKLFSERATLTQTYDTGSEGRFGGQWKAFGLIVERPFGIGSLEFPKRYHHEDVHNVYLSMFLNAGWLGGLSFLLLMVASVLLGARHALRRTRTQGLFLVAFASFAAMVALGALIDTDHWRHLYLLFGLTWGLMLADRKTIRTSRIVADRRPILLRSVIVLPPPRRHGRIVPPNANIICLETHRRRGRQPGELNRPRRLVGPVRPKRPARLLRPAPPYAIGN
ncbi:MAG: O-antigen ligase family protein [Hyphomicrobiaceae bacterium]|nr:O-antigen ligase family protein [Hyphomicrobiaceae bacterium]